MATFTSSFNSLHLNDGEIGLFSAVVLLSQGMLVTHFCGQQHQKSYRDGDMIVCLPTDQRDVCYHHCATVTLHLFADRPRLKSMPRVELLQEQLLDALKLQLTRSHSSDPQLFSNLLMKLTELRAVGMCDHIRIFIITSL